MRSCYRFFRVVFALAVLLAASWSAQAFMPSPWYPVPGKAHPTMTTDALDKIYAAYGYGPGLKPYTKNMQDARKKIADSTAETDSSSSGLNKKPNYHCDDEQLNECSNTVKSDTDEGIKRIQAADYDSARKVIGHVVHTLQDFYSHSNWIEMQSGPVVNHQMGYGNLDNVAAKGENTCSYSPIVEALGPAVACLAMNPNNIITTHLTSGYYKGEGIGIPPGVTKCFHGGSLDGYGHQGINKDASVCSMVVMIVSPHATWHTAAVKAATAATEEYFDTIRSHVTEDEFKKFLGFGPALGFAIDTTGSMADDIAGVKSSVNSILASRLGTDEEPSQYVLAIINDPVVPPAFKTNDSSAFLSFLNSLYAGYGGVGGDCPEFYGQGIYNAISALDGHSSLFTYTDASIKDPTSALSALLLAGSKGIDINVALSGSCNDESKSLRLMQQPKTTEPMMRAKAFSYNDLYNLIAESSGGQVFLVSPSEVGQLTQLSGIFSNNYYTRLMSIDDTLVSGSAKTYEFPVDSTLDTLSISISLLQGANIIVFRPDGTAVGNSDAGVNVLALSRTVAYQIDKPAAGIWKIVLDGTGAFTINVGGNSPLMFNALDFIALENGQDPGYFPVHGYPMTGVPQNIQTSISGDTSDVYFEFRAKDGTLLGSMTDLMTDVTPGAQTLFAGLNVDLPAQPFRVYAVGKDANGMPFERVLSRLIVPQTVAVTGPSDQKLPLNTDTTYVFNVTNYGAADNFTLTAVDDQGFIINLTPTAVSIDTGETKSVSVVLNPGTASALGTVSTTTFMVLPAGSLNALGNYAIVVGTVVEKLDVPPPSATPVPANDTHALLLLAGLLVGLALWQARRMKQHEG